MKKKTTIDIKSISKHYNAMHDELIDFLAGIKLKFDIPLVISTTSNDDENLNIKEISNGSIYGYYDWEEEMLMEDEDVECKEYTYNGFELSRLIELVKLILNSDAYKEKYGGKENDKE